VLGALWLYQRLRGHHRRRRKLAALSTAGYFLAGDGSPPTALSAFS